MAADTLTIQTKGMVAFRYKNLFFRTPAPGVVCQAPGWIVNDPYFWALYEHDKAPVKANDHPAQEGDHPMGIDPLLTVFGEQPERPDGVNTVQGMDRNTFLAQGGMQLSADVVDMDGNPIKKGKEAKTDNNV